MLYQLHLAGVLARQRAVLLGTFNGYELADNDNGYDAAAMVAHARSRFGVRLYTGLPFGHTPEKLTLPVGGRCALAVRDGQARLVLSDYAALSRRAGLDRPQRRDDGSPRRRPGDRPHRTCAR